MKKSKRKIKLLSLTLGVVGLAATPLVTIACGSDSKIVKTVDTSGYQMPTALTFTGEDGMGQITSGLLKPAPTNTHLEYKVNTGAYSSTNPTTLSNGDSVSVNLVADTGYKISTIKNVLDQHVEGLLKTVDTSGYQMPTALTFTGNDGAGTIATSLPTPPTHTHLEYKVNTGAYSSTNPTTLNNGDIVSVNLVADTGYKISTTKNVLDQHVTGLSKIVDTSGYQMPATLTFTGNDGAGTIATSLPTPPTHTYLVYKVNYADYSSTAPTTLSNGDSVSISLVADDGYVVTDVKEVVDQIVEGLSIEIDTSSYQMPTSLTFTGNNGAGTIATSFPTPPTHTHLEYKMNNGSYLPTNPTTLSNGNTVSIRLAADTGYFLSETKELLDQTVHGLSIEIDTSGYQMPTALTFTGNNGAGTIATQLPTPLANTHLEYKVNTGTYLPTNPTTLSNGNTVSIRLAADKGYFVSETKELLNQTVIGLNIEVDVKTYQMPTSLTFTGANGSGSITTGLIPNAPTNTHLEYKVNGTWSKTSPTTLSNGDKVSILLTADKGYYLSETKELLDVLVSGLTP